METVVLAIQAHVLLWVGLGWMVIGCAMGFDPATVTWRAAAAAVATMIVTGYLLRLGVRTIAEKAAAAEAAKEIGPEDAARPAAAARPGRPSS